MISIIINTFNEPTTIGHAIESFINQKISEKYEVIVICPDEETIKVIKKYTKEYSQVKHIKDKGKGKSYALNENLSKIKGRIVILSDGDVFVGDNSVNNLINIFKEKKVGCVSGRPISTNSNKTMLGYWSHLLFYGAHKIRKRLYKEGKFLECSGYLFAFRNNFIKEIPLDVAEDTAISYVFWKRGFKIAYAENALVYVKNPNSFKDWLKQRKRTSKAHETLTKYIKDFPKVKSFSNEVLNGTVWALQYPNTLKEFLWTISLFFARLYMWINVFYDTKIIKEHYKDAWERIESTK